MKKLLFLLIFFSSFSAYSQAQNFELGEFAGTAGIGGNTYMGDLNPEGERMQLNVQLSFSRYVDERTFFKFSLNLGYLQGEYEPGDNLNPALNPNVNQFFSSRVFTADASFNWEIIQWSFLHMYTGAGIGFMDYSIEDSQGRNLNDRPITRLENEDYGTRLAYLPVNLGFVFFPQRQVNIIYERSWNYTNSDYLDNIGYLGDRSSDWILRRMMLVRYRF